MGSPHGIRGAVGAMGQCGQLCPFDKSTAEPRALRIERLGRCVGFTRRRSGRVRLWGPRERWVGGVILGLEGALLRVLKEAGGDRRELKEVRHGDVATRHGWEAVVDAAEGVLGRESGEMILSQRD